MAHDRVEKIQAQVLARALEGDEAAFRAIYDTESEYVRKLILRMSGSADTEDLRQEVFAAAWRSLPSFKGESRLRTWLHSITLRVVWTRLARRDTSLWLELDDARHVPDRSPSMDDRIDLDRALHALPAGARTILLLHEIDGLRYREIADKLDISIGTVKSQLHRARNILVEYLT